jgi:hypothetical protein
MGRMMIIVEETPVLQSSSEIPNGHTHFVRYLPCPIRVTKIPPAECCGRPTLVGIGLPNLQIRTTDARWNWIAKPRTSQSHCSLP